MKLTCLIIGLVGVIFSTSSLADMNSVNEPLWTKTYIVKDGTLLNETKSCKGHYYARISFPQISDSINNYTFVLNKVEDSDRSWYIKTDRKCLNPDLCDPLHNSDIEPSNVATVSCNKYKGLTVRMGPHGKPVIESDNPLQQLAIKKALQDKSDAKE